jgi:hypothetical protein
MDLDEMKQLWMAQETRMGELLRVNARRARDVSDAESASRRLMRFLQAELAFTVPVIIWLGSFNYEHLGEPRFLIPGLLLHLCLIGGMGAAIHQLVTISRLDYAGPIVAIQRRLESLRVIRLHLARAVLMLSTLIWLPMLIVAMKGFLGVDAYEIFSGGWVAANILLGLAVLAGGMWTSVRYADRMEQSPLLRRIMRDLAGTNLNAAADAIDRIDRFAAEPRPA